MRIINTLFIGATSIILSIVFHSCKTEDVLPTVNLESSVERFDFNEGTAEVIAILNGPVNRELAISFLVKGGATLDEDFRVSSNRIIVGRGSDRGSITLIGIPSTDTVIKQIEISIVGDGESFIVGENSSLLLELQNCSLDRDGDGVPDCDDECPTIPGPPENNGCPWEGLIFNEILFDPPQGIAGDANGDGVRQPQEDEFIELFNSNPDLDISGYTISDDVRVRHVFPSGTVVPSKGSIVIFGGGTPTGDFGGSIVQIASTGLLSLSRDGDIITVRDNFGQEISVFDINNFNNRPAASFTRNPDSKGEFELHPDIPEAQGARFSPGTKLDGTRFLD